METSGRADGEGLDGEKEQPCPGVGVCLEGWSRRAELVLLCCVWGCLEMFNSPGLERNLNSLPQEQRQTKVGHYDIKAFPNLVHSLILWEGNLNFFQGVVPAGEDLES